MITNPTVGRHVIVRYTSAGTPLSGNEDYAEAWYRRLGTRGVISYVSLRVSDTAVMVAYNTPSGNTVTFSTNCNRLDYYDQLPGMCRASADL